MRKLGGIAAIIVTSFSAAASAQPNDPVMPTEEDLVVLKDGTRYRGVIVETVPNDHLLIEVADGVVRQAPLDEVAYAGPLKGGPAMVPIAVVAPLTPSQSWGTQYAAERAPQPGEVLVHFQTATPGLVVWASSVSAPVADGSGAGFVRLCEAPCARPLRLGAYQLAYSVGSDQPLATESLVHIHRETWLQTQLESRRGLRVFGWVVFGLGAGTGTGLFTAAAQTNNGHRTRLYVAGGISLGVGLVFGLPLGLKSDTAVVVSLGPRREQPAQAAGSRDSFKGLSFVGRF